jgi:hypothetical protein
MPDAWSTWPCSSGEAFTCGNHQPHGLDDAFPQARYRAHALAAHAFAPFLTVLSKPLDCGQLLAPVHQLIVS